MQHLDLAARVSKDGAAKMQEETLGATNHRSPGYDGPAMESKKQEMVDSTRPPSWETSLKDLGSNIPVPSMWPREAACGRQNCFWWLYHCCVVRGLEPEMPAADFSLMKRGVEKTDAD